MGRNFEVRWKFVRFYETPLNGLIQYSVKTFSDALNVLVLSSRTKQTRCQNLESLNIGWVMEHKRITSLLPSLRLGSLPDVEVLETLTLDHLCAVEPETV